MKEKQKIFRGSLRNCRKEKEKIQVDNLVGSYNSKDFGKFWQQVRQDERTPKFFSEKVEDASTPEEIAEFWKNHFESQFSDPQLNIDKCHLLIQEYKSKSKLNFKPFEVWQTEQIIKFMKKSKCRTFVTSATLFATLAGPAYAQTSDIEQLKSAVQQMQKTINELNAASR